jgi:prephenate dehydrogenase
MKLNTNQKILIVGLGLLGGSYARALTKKGFFVTAITRSQSSIDYALEEKIIAKGSAFVDPKLIGEADIVVFALYPHVFIDWIRENQQFFKSGAIITDVTGVKESIVGTIQDMLRSDVEFIAAHPMAGREVYGVQNSDDSIFKGANYVVTPSEKNSPSAIELCRDLGKTLGFAKVSELSPKDHDKIIAFVSQLTHCIAISLMTCQKTEHLEDYTGDSFRDLTRIARLNEDMWSELFLINKTALLHQLTLFEGELNHLRCMLEENDVEGLKDMMRYSTARRALFDKKPIA